MSATSLAVKTYLKGVLNAEIAAAKKFFNKSLILIALTAAALAILNPYLEKLKKEIAKKLAEPDNASTNKNSTTQNNNDKALSQISDKNNISDDDIYKYVKNNRALQNILNYVSNDINQSAVGDISSSCDDPNYYDNKSKEIADNLKPTQSTDSNNSNGDDYINAALETSDFDKDTDNLKNNLDTSNNDNSNKGSVRKDLQKLFDSIEGILPYLFLFAFIILEVKKLITESEHPSGYRGKYLQRLIRYLSAMLKAEVEGAKAGVNALKKSMQGSIEQIKNTLKSLKIIDAIIIAVLAATIIYINNRKKHQKDSLNEISDKAKKLTCEEQNLEPFDPSINTKPISLDVSLNFNNITSSILNLDVSTLNTCPIDKSNEPIIPHQPFESKLNNMTNCEITQTPPNLGSQSTDVETTDLSDAKGLELATKAIYQNISKEMFNTLVKVNQFIDTNTVLGTLDGNDVYSPINGIVTNVYKDNIIISNISDPKTDPMEQLIKQTQDLYKELNDTKLFLKDFYINSLYPVMLNNAPSIDVSLSKSQLSNITYITGGVTDRFSIIKNDYESLKSTYENNVKSIVGKDNITEKSNNDDLNSIKIALDNQELTFFDNIQILSERGINESKITLPLKSEYTLLDYYFLLYQDVLSNYDLNEIIIPFRDELSNIITERIFIDKWDLNKVQNKINEMCNKISSGTYLQNNTDYYNQMINKYNETHNINDVSIYVNSLVSTDNSTYSTDDIQKTESKIMYIFDFTLNIIQDISLGYKPKLTKKQELSKESSFIETYFKTLYKRYKEEIPKELNDVLSKIKNRGKSPVTYTLIKKDDEQYRYYSSGKKRDCPILIEENDDYTSPFSKYGYGDIEYWNKYCTFATLASATNPITGWATGVPPPTGPILLPIVYIPLTVVEQKWGVIVIGLTICGMWVYPFVLIVNFSMLFHIPFIDPVVLIEATIDAVKTEITNTITMLKQITIKGYLDDLKNQLDGKNSEIKNLRDRQKAHKFNKPRKDKGKINYAINYAIQLSAWTEDEISMTTQMISLNTEKLGLELKYAAVYAVYNDSPPKENDDEKVKSIQKTQEKNNKLFEYLKTLVESIDAFIMPLPNATMPVSASFMFTLKNPKPLVHISDELSDNVNKGEIDKIMEMFRLKSDDFMNPNFKSIDWKKYTDALKLAMFVLIKKDAFPKYENLKITNIPWIYFLYNDFVPTGKSCFGFPGFP